MFPAEFFLPSFQSSSFRVSMVEQAEEAGYCGSNRKRKKAERPAKGQVAVPYYVQETRNNENLGRRRRTVERSDHTYDEYGGAFFSWIGSDRI
jgi:hypothetical protein